MTISESIIYAMAVVLSLCLSFYACSAEAAGVSKRQVKRIAKQTVIQEITARAPDLRGEPGPQGPPGPRGLPGAPGGAQSPAGAAGTLPFIYARITPLGEVDESRSDGITDSEVTYFYGPGGQVHYCFTMPAVGVQVTIDGSEAPAGAVPHTRLLSQVNNGCNTFVTIFHNGNAIHAGFFITIY